MTILDLSDGLQGKIAIHEIFAENTLVSYWEKFGAIAFDTAQKAILTTCVLKSLDKESKEPEMKCCFSFTIRRDTHAMLVPSLTFLNFSLTRHLVPHSSSATSSRFYRHRRHIDLKTFLYHHDFGMCNERRGIGPAVYSLRPAAMS